MSIFWFSVDRTLYLGRSYQAVALMPFLKESFSRERVQQHFYMKALYLLLTKSRHLHIIWEMIYFTENKCLPYLFKVWNAFSSRTIVQNHQKVVSGFSLFLGKQLLSLFFPWLPTFSTLLTRFMTIKELPKSTLVKEKSKNVNFFQFFQALF